MAQQGKQSPARLSGYHPTLDRAIFVLAMLGVLVAVHLWIQQGRGFAEGCTGFGDAGASVFDCGAVVSSAAGTFLGVSNTLWGLVFYLGVGLLTALAAVGPAGWLRPSKMLRLGLVGFGFLYSAYLTLYQFTQLDARCLLCLLSAGIVTVIAVLVVLDARRVEAPASAAKHPPKHRPGKKAIA